MMKSKFMALMGLSLSLSAFSATEDPVIMKIDGQNVYKSEFEYIYHKNNSTASKEQKSLDEYVDLFVNYKLKVCDAEHLGYKDKPSFISEYEKYKYQLASPYLRDEEAENKLLEEAFERNKKSILASHILIGCGQDTVEAFKKVNDIYDRLQKGESFESLASQYSDCPSKRNGGSLGYVNVFQMIYDFENVVYNTPLGTISRPFRTQFGYHIVKTFDEKANYKDVRISHVMIKTDDQVATSKADSIFALAKKGADFEKLAQKYSVDKATANIGGDLGYLTKGLFPQEVTKQVRLLRGIGEVAMVGSPMGFHIIKITEVVPWTKIEECKSELENKLMRSDRVTRMAECYILKLKEKYGVSVYKNSLCLFDDLSKTEDKELKAKYYRLLSEPMFNFDGNVYSQTDFVPVFNKALIPGNYKKTESVNLIDSPQENVDPEGMACNVFNQYLNKLIVERETDYIEATNSEFRNLLKEYSDGLLLFEISSDKVWNYATADKKGLDSFFTANKNKYVFDQPKYKGVVICSKTQEVNDDVEKILKENDFQQAETMIYDKYGSQGLVKINRGLYSKGANKIVDAKIFSEGTYSDDQYPFVAMRGSVISAPQDYSDVKGQVTSDYQNELEKEWIKSLRKRYSVEIYKNVLKTVK